MNRRICFILVYFMLFLSIGLGYNYYSECSELGRTDQLEGIDASNLQYDNTYIMDFTCPQCDSIISKSDSIAYVMIQMSNNFPAGDTNEAIIVNFDMGANFKCPDLVRLQGAPVFFGLHAMGNDGFYASVYQIYDQNRNNYYPACASTEGVNDLFVLELEADLASIHPWNFDDKYVSVEFHGAFGEEFPCTSLTWDTSMTTVVKEEYGNLHFKNDSIMVLMGEFSVARVTGEVCSATQSLYVRNTFDLDTFSIQVHSPDLRVEINSINNSVLIGVSSSKVNDYTFNVYSNSNFSSISANGDDYTKVAEINYTIDGACNPPGWIYIIPEFSDKLMRNGAGKEQYVVLDADTLAIYCQACASGGISKLASDEDNSGLLPTEYALYPCRPNPFNPSTDIAFDVPVMCPVTITIYNILGQEVTTLVDREMEAGRHSVIWNSTDKSGRAVSSGIYLCVMRAGEFTASQKMSLMK